MTIRYMKDKLEPLTMEEQETADKNHHYIYIILNMLGYSDEEFYDIAAIGFLRGIQAYHRRVELRTLCSLFTVCKYRIHREISHYFRAQRAIKRKPPQPVLSLDATKYNSDESYDFDLYNSTISIYDTARTAISNVEIQRIFRELTERQGCIVIMKMEGYTMRCIMDKLSISTKILHNELDSIKEILMVG